MPPSSPCVVPLLRHCLRLQLRRYRSVAALGRVRLEALALLFVGMCRSSIEQEEQEPRSNRLARGIWEPGAGNRDSEGGCGP